MNKFTVATVIAVVIASQYAYADQYTDAADKAVEAAQQKYNDAVYQLGSGVDGSPAEAELKAASAVRAQAYADERSRAMLAAHMDAIASQNIKNAQTPTATSVTPSITGTSYRNAVNSMINVAVSTLAPNLPVKVTKDGKTTETTAGELAKLNPNVQVSVPYSSVFQKVVRSGNNNSSSSHASRQGTGNGGNNAANSNSAHGLGGGSNIGGGRSGGGFHY